MFNHSLPGVLNSLLPETYSRTQVSADWESCSNRREEGAAEPWWALILGDGVVGETPQYLPLELMTKQDEFQYSQAIGVTTLTVLQICTFRQLLAN